MPVVLVHQGGDSRKTATRRLFEGLPAGGDSVRLATGPWEGLLIHAAGEAPDGFRVVDVWESEDAAGRFGEQLVPVLRELGIEAEPELYPTHTFISA